MNIKTKKNIEELVKAFHAAHTIEERDEIKAKLREINYERVRAHFGTNDRKFLEHKANKLTDERLGKKHKPKEGELAKIWKRFVPFASDKNTFPFARLGSWAMGLGLAGNYIISSLGSLTGGFWSSAGQFTALLPAAFVEGICGAVMGFGAGLVFDSAFFGGGLLIKNGVDLWKEYFPKKEYDENGKKIIPKKEKKSILHDVRFWSGMGYIIGSIAGGVLGLKYATYGLGLIKDMLAPFETLSSVIDLVRTTVTEFLPAYVKTVAIGLFGVTAGAVTGAACGTIPGFAVGIGRKIGAFFSGKATSDQGSSRSDSVQRDPRPANDPPRQDAHNFSQTVGGGTNISSQEEGESRSGAQKARCFLGRLVCGSSGKNFGSPAPAYSR